VAFFVGTSPECEVAVGTVAYFELVRQVKQKIGDVPPLTAQVI